MLAVAFDGVTEMLVSVGWPAPQPSKRSAADSRGKTESLRLIFMVFAPRVRCCLKALHASPAQASIRRPERAIGLALPLRLSQLLIENLPTNAQFSAQKPSCFAALGRVLRLSSTLFAR